MRVVVKILKWIVIVVVAIFGGFLLINVFDEELKPEAAAYVQLPKPRFADGENAYFAFMGFLAPAGAQPHAVGREIIAAYETALAKNPFLDTFKADDYLKGAKLSVQGKPESCDPGKERCLDRYLADEALFRQLLSDNQVLLERYRALYSYPHFEETATPGIAAPIAGFPVRLVPLVNAEIAFDVQRGEYSRALDRLEQDIAFWRRLLRESRTLVSKMVAVGALHRDYRLLSEMVDFDAAAAQHFARIRKLVVLLDRQEANIAECMRWEAAMGDRVLRSISAQDKSWWSGYLLHATLNESYEKVKAHADLAELPAFRLQQAKKDLERKDQEESDSWWRHAYNPVGRIFNSNSVAYAPYVERVHDLDGYMRLVALQMQISQRRLSDAEIPGFLKSAGKRYADPYTDRPMQWDPRRRLILFKGMSKQIAGSGIVAVRIGNPGGKPAEAN